MCDCGSILVDLRVGTRLNRAWRSVPHFFGPGPEVLQAAAMVGIPMFYD